MNYQSQVHFTAQPITGLKLKQQLRGRKALSLPGGNSFWYSLSKVLCATVVIVFGLTLLLGNIAKQTSGVIQAVEAKHHTIRNEQMTLLAERARLMSKSNIVDQAKIELALYVPRKGQVYKLR